MAEDGRLARVAGRSASGVEPTLSDLLDPIALEERLKAARARRAEALARRPAPLPDASLPVPAEPAALPAPEPQPTPQPEPAPATVLAAPPRRQPTRAASRRSLPAIPILVFLAGLGLGGAAVAILAALPARIAAIPDPAPAATAPAAAAPVVATAPAAVAPVVAAASPDAAPTAAAPARSAAPVVAAAPPPGIAPLATAPEPPPAVAPPAATAEAPPRRDPASLAAPLAEAAPPEPARLAAEIPAATADLPAQVLIHYPASAADEALAAREALRTAGVTSVEVIPARYAIGRSNIRYYHASDRAPATALAPLIAPALGAAPEARDFTDYPTPAAAGKVEIWLAGTPAAARSTRRSPAPAAPEPEGAAGPLVAAPLAMPDILAPAPTRAEQVERILVERLRRAR